jgi:nucleotide-binding universal stress UspA family protein
LAATLADGRGARVLLAHVLDPGTGVADAAAGAEATDLDSLLDSKGRSGLRALYRALFQVPPRVPAELRVLAGEVAEELASLAASEGSELIVVGSRKRGPLGSAFVGSCSSKLATRAPVPVVISPSARGGDGGGVRVLDELARPA